MLLRFLTRVLRQTWVVCAFILRHDYHRYRYSNLFAFVDCIMMQCTKVLLDNGADPDTQTSDGTSVLSVAIFDGDAEVMLRLLSCRCSLRGG